MYNYENITLFIGTEQVLPAQLNMNSILYRYVHVDANSVVQTLEKLGLWDKLK